MRVLPYLKLARFPLVFTAVADSAAGYLLSREGAVDPLALSLLAVASACLYGCGMVFNDVADYLRDLVLHPERPLPSKQVSVTAARRFGMALMFVGAGAACVVNFMTGQVMLLIFVLIMAYNFYAKESAVAGPAVMGLVRGANFLMGVIGSMPRDKTFALPGWGPGAYEQALLLAAYVFFLTFVSTLEEAPRSPRRRRREEAAGPEPPFAMPGSRVRLFLGGAAGMSLCALAPQGLARSAASLAAAGAVAAALFGHALLVARRPERGAVMRQVRWGVLAIIAIDASMVLATRPPVYGLAVLGLAAPALALLPVFKRL